MVDAAGKVPGTTKHILLPWWRLRKQPAWYIIFSPQQSRRNNSLNLAVQQIKAGMSGLL
jgi:hypothetical protein